MTHRVVLGLVAVLLLGACGGTDGPSAPVVDGDGTAGDPAGAWVLAEADPPIELPADARVTLEVTPDGDAWQVGGTAACNSYGGTVVTEGGRWRSEGYAHTEMGCEEPLMSVEQAYLGALSSVDAWARPTADELMLTGPDVELQFAALPLVPTADLTATTWVLDGLVSGPGADASVSSSVSTADEATLRLDEDGTMEASTGCRAFEGEWTEAGDEVVLTTFGEREDSPSVATDGSLTCDEAVVAQEDHVLSVLGDGFRAEVDGQRLTLVSRDGRGLTYRNAS